MTIESAGRDYDKNSPEDGNTPTSKEPTSRRLSLKDDADEDDKGEEELLLPSLLPPSRPSHVD